jgi:carboxymethylenebutenolidase
MAGGHIFINARDGGSFRAYLAKPASGGPALVLLQAILGVNQDLRNLADDYAAEGFVVLVPDLFWRLEPGIELGTSEADLKRAFAYSARFDADKAALDIGATVDVARGLAGTTGKVGALGHCLGGKLAYLAATRCGVDAAVGYYGVGIEKLLAESGRARCPMVLHFGGADHYVPMAAVAEIRAHFANRPEVEIYDYPGAEHGFALTGRPYYHEAAATAADARSMVCLRRALGPAATSRNSRASVRAGAP